MDILSTKLLDAGRAHKILSNTHKRFGRLRRKTDEEYLRIIIDEVNLYFSELSSSIMDISKLPDNKDGPSSIAHNDTLNSIISSIDDIRSKQKFNEDMITKAVNYMSIEREGVGRAASKLHSRIISYKNRSSSNNRGSTVFHEFFNDNGLTDIKESTNIMVDSTQSVLTLGAVSINKDNSILIDQNSIEIIPVIDVKRLEDKTNYTSIYPLSNQTKPHMGFGATISSDNPSSYDANLRAEYSPNDSEGDSVDTIKSQAIKIGNIFEENHAEFELVWNDFSIDGDRTNIENSLIKSGLGRIAESQSWIFGIDEMNSFSGAKEEFNKNIYNSINEFDLKFKIKSGAIINGFPNRIVITFVKSGTGGIIPNIDAGASTIDSRNAFTEKTQSIENSITEKLSLRISRILTTTEEFTIRLKVPEGAWSDITNYWGCYFIHSLSTVMQGTSSHQDVHSSYQTNRTTSGTDIRQTDTRVGKVWYVYNDFIRRGPEENRLITQQIFEKYMDNKFGESFNV